MIRVGALKLKAQLLCGVEGAMGPGKADLLEAIDRTGSISAAGRALGMSYRRCWLLVDAMNRCWHEKLVETAAGGGLASRLGWHALRYSDGHVELSQEELNRHERQGIAGRFTT